MCLIAECGADCVDNAVGPSLLGTQDEVPCPSFFVASSDCTSGVDARPATAGKSNRLAKPLRSAASAILLGFRMRLNLTTLVSCLQSCSWVSPVLEKISAVLVSHALSKRALKVEHRLHIIDIAGLWRPREILSVLYLRRKTWEGELAAVLTALHADLTRQV